MELAAEAGPFDLLITDVILPDIDGDELARRLRASMPGLKVLFTSGHSSEVLTDRGIQEQGEDFLPKPFGTADLCAKVRKLCDR